MDDILSNIGLTPEQKAFRRKVIGGSDANTLMSGNDERILHLWKEKRGEAESDDLSDVLQVMLGNWTEPFNRAWFTKQSKRPVTNVGDQLICLDHPFMGATLDGMTDDKSVLWEAKHVSAFTKDEEVMMKYYPQLTHNMIVCGVSRAILSVIFGNHRYQAFEVDFNETYAIRLLEVEKNFWDCVQNGIEPVIVAPKYEGPVARIVDMTGNNEWASAAKDFLDTMEAAKLHDDAKDSIKELIEADVVEARGHGIVAKRSKTNAITIKKDKK